MYGKRKKLTTSLLLQVSYDCTTFVVESSGCLICSNLSAQNYSSLPDV
jgi:hypothetical protein